MDLRPYKTHLTAIQNRYNEMRASLKPIFEGDLKDLSQAVHVALAHLREYETDVIQSQMAQFRTEYLHLNSMLDSIKAIATNDNNRKKRALLPFVGDVLSFLFGTVSQGQLDQLKEGLIQLGNTQNNIAHVLKHSLTLINKTNLEVQRNRNTINQLTRGLTHLDSRVSAVIMDLQTSVHPLLLYQQMSKRIHTTFEAMERCLRIGYQSLVLLNSELQDVLGGKLPITLLPPSDLQNIIQAILRQAPEGLRPPINVNENPRWYYEKLRATLLPDNDQMHIVFALPLIQADSLYTLYNAVVVPTPHPTQKALASYILEGQNIAVSASGNHYVILSELDSAQCKADLGYCSFSHPVASLARFPTCISSLFTKNKRDVIDYCRPKIEKDLGFPTVRHLFQDKWLVSTSQEMTFHISCLAERQEGSLAMLRVNDPVQILELGLGCTGYNDYITLPSYFVRETTREISTQFHQHRSELETLPNIWEVTTKARKMVEFSPDIAVDIPSLLPNVSKLPVDDLLNNLDYKPWSLPMGNTETTYLVVGIVTVTVLIILATVLCVLRRKVTAKRCGRYTITKREIDSPETVDGEAKVSLHVSSHMEPAGSTLLAHPPAGPDIEMTAVGMAHFPSPPSAASVAKATAATLNNVPFQTIFSQH